MLIASIAAFVFLMILLKSHRNTFLLTTNEIEVKVNHCREKKDADTGSLRILHLSDLHMENLSIPAEQIVTTTQGESFDLIAITGDLLDRKRSIPHAIRYIEKLWALQPSLGIFVVFGNHDYVLPADKLAYLRQELERIGCVVLCNETRTVASSLGKLHIIGVDDYATRRSDLAKTFAPVADDGIRLVLTHDPNIVLHMTDYPYDYLLAGHFHGGQIHWPKPYHLVKMGSLPRMNIVQGLHYHDERPFYISEGLGQTGLNIRLRSRPEMTIHTLA